MKKYLHILLILSFLFGSVSFASAELVNTGIKLTRTLMIGAKGDDVKSLQQILIDKGFLTGKADGSFGPKTRLALINFQRANNLGVDGKAGPKVRDFLAKTIVVADPPSPKTCLPTDEPRIQVVSPNGGEIYSYNSQIPVKWKSCNVASTDYLRIGLLQFDSNNMIIENVAVHTETGNAIVQNSGSATIFDLPNTGGWGTYIPGNFYRISLQVCSIGTPTNCTMSQTVTDQSDNLFTINNEPVMYPYDPDCSGTKYNTKTGNLCGGYGGIGGLTGIPTFNRTLKIGTKGKDVEALQKLLNIKADGVYGRGTAGKVKLWQVAHGLPADGAFGAKSRAKLLPTPTVNKPVGDYADR